MANEIERRRWNNDGMVANWPKRERFTDQVVPYVVAALGPKPGEKVLDIGSGGGKLSLAIGEAVAPGGKVTGADISAGMVKMATDRAAAAKATNVSFVAADVQSEPVPGGPFDAATSQFGVMFFDERVAAFTNIRRQLKRGGRLAFACWQGADRNAWHVGPALAQFVPEAPAPPPGKSPTGPFALGSARSTRAMLTAAGFAGIMRVPKRLVIWTSEDAIADDSQITRAGIPPERQDEARAAMNRHFDQSRRASDGLCRFELNFQLFTARVG